MQGDDFVKVGTNEEDMRSGVSDRPHHWHAHDEACGEMEGRLEEHREPKEVTHEEKNEHTEPEEIKNREEVGEAGKGTYPGMIRKIR